ncbi:NAD-dependent epimerase/dehydratase family protein [Spirillospora sp. CA-255316]
MRNKRWTWTAAGSQDEDTAPALGFLNCAEGRGRPFFTCRWGWIMRVFVTGATGFIGSTVVRELIDAGHQVVGLAREDKAAAALWTAGAQAHAGDLDDLDSLCRGAAAVDGVIRLAFTNISASTDFAASCRADQRAIQALGETLAGAGRPFAVTSVTLLFASGLIATEDAPVVPAHPRAPPEQTALAFADRGVRVSVVRLSPSVHGTGDRGIRPGPDRHRPCEGVSAFVGDGANRWPAVRRLDAARPFLLALEDAPPGIPLHAVDDEGVPLREIAEVIGDHLKVPVSSVASEHARRPLRLARALRRPGSRLPAP